MKRKTKIIINFFMLQQKQQKNTRAQNSRYKEQTKIGSLTKKCNLPPIETRSSSRSKLHNSLNQFVSPKKHKMSDIYYEEVSDRKLEKPRINSVIFQKESNFQNSLNCQDDQGQTVMKIHQKRKTPQNFLHLCNFHQKRICNQLEKQQKSDKALFKIKAHQCCQTQPSDDQSCKDSRVNLFFHHNQSSNLNLRNSLIKNQKSLRPLKINCYQKPELFAPATSKHFPAERILNNRDFLSPNQAQSISDKLSKPKYTVGCGKRNCQCFNEDQLSKCSPIGRDFRHYESERQISTKKINININKLNKMNNEEIFQVENQNNLNSFQNKIVDKRTWRKNIKLQQLKRSGTQIKQSEFCLNNCIQNEQGIEKSGFSSRRLSSDDESFIKGIVTPSKTTIQHNSNISRSTDDVTNLRKDHTVEIQIQTEDILIVNPERRSNQKQSNKSSHEINQTKNSSIVQENQQIQLEKIKQIDVQSLIKGNHKTFSKEQIPLSQQKNLKFSIGQKKGTIDIGYTFGNKKQSKQLSKDNLNFKAEQNNIHQKSIKEKLQNLESRVQYWIGYNIEKNKFINFLNVDNNLTNQKNQQKINLVRQVVNEKILFSKTQQVEQDQQEKNSKDLHIPRIGSVVNIQKIVTISDIIDLKQPQKKQLSQQSRILAKSRNCTSSISNKSSINMFNRSPKSRTSAQSKKLFKVPKEQQYVDFIKNYKPNNPQIIIPILIQEDTFKVIPSPGKFYFGRTTHNNINHGIGVEITQHQIFEGQYVDGNRKKGFLKQNDGVYLGHFQNNLRHGHGIFRWNDGQIFQGQWRMGTKNGYGIWTGPDGSYYEGEWHLSMQHGKGKFVHSTSTYDGDFKNFCKEGSGKQTFPNGDTFTGEYKNGKPNGKGKYEWKNGTYYDGTFVQGLREGFGKWHQNSNSFYEGYFLKDEKHGQGVEYYKDGSYLQGQFFMGKIAKGKLYNSRKQIIREFDEQFQQDS